MPTNDRRINIYPKRLLSLTAIGEYFFDFLNGEIDEVVSAIFQGTAGTLDSDEIEIASTLADTFTLNTANASRVVVGTGQIIDLSLLAASLYTQVPFENLTGTIYSVGIKFAEVPDVMEINPRTGDPEYRSFKQTCGELAAPDSVADNTTYIRLTINSIMGSSEDHTGRTVRIWLVDPVSGVDSVAFYEGTSAYSSPNNYVDIPYSGGDGPLGQDTDAGPPSTTAADYQVFIEGPTWRNKANKDLRADSDYAFIGEITGLTGSIPVGFDISGQVPIFINTLDRAYDGAAGSGSGRLIAVDAEAVELLSRSGMTDEHRAALRVDRKDDSTQSGTCIQTIMDQDRGASSMQCIPLTHSVGNLIVDNPVSVTSADVVTKSGAVDWAASNVNPRTDLAWLQGLGTSTDDGLYQIVAVAASTLQLRTINGVVPTLTVSETCNVTILRAAQIVSSFAFGSLLNPMIRGTDGTSFLGWNDANVPVAGSGGEDVRAAANFYGAEVDQCHFFDNGVAAPRTNSWINKYGIFKSAVGLTIQPDQSITSHPIVGLYLDASVGDGTNPLDVVPSAKHHLGAVKDAYNNVARLFEASGRVAEPHVFKDDFHYHASKWNSLATAPPQYVATGTGSGVVFQGNNGPLYHGGAAILRATAAANESANLAGGLNWRLDTSLSIFLNYFSRVAVNYQPTALATRREYHGLRDNASSYQIIFEHDNAAHGNDNWWLVVDDGTNPTEKVDTGIGFWYDGANNPRYLNFYFSVIGDQTIMYWVQGMVATPQTMTLSTISFNGAAANVRLEANENNGGLFLTEMLLDYWEVRDNVALQQNQGQQVY